MTLLIELAYSWLLQLFQLYKSKVLEPCCPGDARDIGQVENVDVALLVGATYGLPLVKAIPSMLWLRAWPE